MQHKEIVDFLSSFKTTLCPLGIQCSLKRYDCPYHHIWYDRRRNPYQRYYCAKLCRDGDFCNDEDACLWAHNYAELWFHPFLYRTVFCKRKDRCTIVHCPYAHSIKELQQEEDRMTYDYSFLRRGQKQYKLKVHGLQILLTFE